MPNQEIMPDAIAGGRRIISLESGRHIVVTRWNFARLIAIGKLFAEFSSLRAEDMSDPVRILDVLGPKVQTFIEISVLPESVPHIEDASALDTLNIIEAILELNPLEKILKKVLALKATIVKGVESMKMQAKGGS